MAAPPPVLIVAVDKGPRKGETRQCCAGSVLRVGRVVKGNDLAVRDLGVSQQHLVIKLHPPAARWAVSDLGSSNGSLLNGEPIPVEPSSPVPLSHGDLIKIGESTVLAVSISSDSDPVPGATAKPGVRRSSRHAEVSVVEEEESLPAVTGRGTRKKALAAAAVAPEIPEAVNEKPDAAAPMVVEEKCRAVTRRGKRKKATAAEPPEEIEEAAEATRHGKRKKPVESEKDEEEAAAVTRRGRWKKAAEPPESEREEEDKAEEARVVTRRRGRKEDVVTIASPPLRPSTRSRSGRGRPTNKAVLEDDDTEEQERNEKDADKKAAPSEQTGNPSTSTTSMVSEDDKRGKTAAGYRELEVPTVLDVELPKGMMASAQLAASDSAVAEENGGTRDEEDGKECAQRSSLETMTLREWFQRMEKYLPRMINEAADKMIADLEDRHRQIHDYISTLRY